MNTTALDCCLQLQAAHARLQLALDDGLGTWHGLSLADFVLLRAVDGAGDGGLATAQLVPPLGVQRSAVVRQLLQLEKTGLVERVRSPQGERRVLLRGPGRALLHEAAATVASLCEDAAAGLDLQSLAAGAASLQRLASGLRRP